RRRDARNLLDVEEAVHPVHRVRVAGAEREHAGGEVVPGRQLDVEPTGVLLGEDTDGGDRLVDELRGARRRGGVLRERQERVEDLFGEVGRDGEHGDLVAHRPGVLDLPAYRFGRKCAVRQDDLHLLERDGQIGGRFRGGSQLPVYLERFVPARAER